MNTYLTYQKQLPEKSQKELLKKTETTLSKVGNVHFDSTYHNKQKQQVTGQIYNLLASGMFMSIFSGYAAVNLAFNRETISRPTAVRQFLAENYHEKLRLEIWSIQSAAG